MFEALLRFISYLTQHLSCGQNRFLRTENVQVRLHSETWMVDEIRSLRKTFEYDVFQTRSVETISHFYVSCLYPLESFRIVRNIAVDSVTDPIRQVIPTSSTQWDRQMQQVTDW